MLPALTDALQRLKSGAFDWLVVTSATTVDVLVSQEVTVPGDHAHRRGRRDDRRRAHPGRLHRRLRAEGRQLRPRARAGVADVGHRRQGADPAVRRRRAHPRRRARGARARRRIRGRVPHGRRAGVRSDRVGCRAPGASRPSSSPRAASPARCNCSSARSRSRPLSRASARAPRSTRARRGITVHLIAETRSSASLVESLVEHAQDAGPQLERNSHY